MEVIFSEFEITKYLKRINYAGDITPSLHLLHKLQKLHLLNIPFENLDIHYGNKIILDIDRIYDKIINKIRGGFCYELNGLFYVLLKSLRFNVKRVSARVYSKDDNYGPEFDHLAILVNFYGIEYLSDVGFGEFSFAPLKLELDNILHDERGDYIFDKYDNEYFRVSKMENDRIVPEYIFISMHRNFLEFSEMCEFHQTNPNSHFTQKKLISLPIENGRISLNSDKLKISGNNKTSEVPITNEEDFGVKLQTYFEINLSEIKNNSDKSN